VKDYAGENIGMPLSVSKLEDAIDSLADTGRWTKGNAGTVPALSEENWDFESAEAASTLARVAQYGNADAVRDLVAAGVPLSGGEAAALPEAASRRDVKMLRVLLQAGAAAQDPQARDSALAAAASSGSIEAIRLLLEHGANPNSLDEYGGTVLAHAAASGIPEVVETILAYQQDVNAKNNMGTTALMVVVDAWRGSVEAPPVNRAEVVRLLLQAGADPNAQDEEGNTALIDCSWDADAALLLIKHGADVNARNKRGITPLINASAPEVVRVLLQNGADPTARDADGKTALEWAKQYGWKDKAAILEATSVGRKN
jgi:ankyrin repeat protein